MVHEVTVKQMLLTNVVSHQAKCDMMFGRGCEHEFGIHVQKKFATCRIQYVLDLRPTTSIVEEVFLNGSPMRTP